MSILARRISSLPERVAAVEHDIAGGEELGELPITCSVICRPAASTQTARGGRERLHQLVETSGACRAVAAQRGNRLGVVVVNDRLVAIFNEAAGDIAAHAAETDHADLHNPLRSRQCTLTAASSRRGRRQIALEMHPERAPAALEQTPKSPRACAAFTTPKLARCAGIGKSSASSARDLQKHAAVRPPL